MEKHEWPVGTPVAVTLDDGTIDNTVTTSEPWQLGDGTWVVKLKDHRGGYLLDRCELREQKTAEACSFCDKTKKEVAKLVQREDGSVSICNECLTSAIGVMVSGKPTSPDPATLAEMVAREMSEKDRARAWIQSNDTGASSKTIWSVMTGSPVGCSEIDVPYDPADFGRCHRLLRLIPEWEPLWRDTIADKYPAWKPFAEDWDTLVAIYDDELPSEDGKAPRLYKRLQELADQARRLREP